MNKSARVFVTGGTGFIGTKLVDELVQKGHRVHVLMRSTGNKDGLEHEGVHFFPGDILDRDSLERAMQGCQQVYHLAAYARNWAPDCSTYYKSNVEGASNLLETAKALEVERVVFTSTCVTCGPTPAGIVGDERMPRLTQCYLTEYEASKTTGEQLALKHADQGLPVVIVNPTRVYGPGKLTEGNSVSRMIDLYDRGKFPLLLNRGVNVGNYVFVGDLVRGLILAMEKGRAGERYILGGENASLKRFFEIIDEVSGRKHFKINVPSRLVLFYSRLEGKKAKWLGLYPTITPGWVETFLCDWHYSCEKAEKELGYKTTSLKEGIRITYEWLQQFRKRT